MPNDKLTIAACKFRVQLTPDAKPESSEQESPAEPADPSVRIIRAKDAAGASRRAASSPPRGDAPRIRDTDKPPVEPPDAPDPPHSAGYLPVLDGDSHDIPPQLVE